MGHGKNDVGTGPDLAGNTIDAGSSAAQLPQRNILERKEVLIGEEHADCLKELGLLKVCSCAEASS